MAFFIHNTYVKAIVLYFIKTVKAIVIFTGYSHIKQTRVYDPNFQSKGYSVRQKLQIRVVFG